MENCYKTPQGMALIHGGPKAPTLLGRVEFFQRKDGVLVVAQIRGLPKNENGFYGFHIHQGSTCTGIDFADSGNHYNPQNTPHPNHSGDLPPLLASNGSAYLAVVTNRFRVNDIVGKTVIIHNNPDDFTTQPAGNAGTKIACGVVKKV